ncbi:Phenylacetic acid catabolic protein [Longimicrobium sp.]|uniref:1,2-phenylacetyl-CoA epoxidase subunit PaaC n=1 Tax=Longimicrobium sp. TaxID=2029185 RepID=UPI003B3A8560
MDTEARVESAAELSDDARAALRSLILTLADSKRVLGLRYSDRMLGAPTLEAGIAASSMAQDEWGHARLTYALLGDFGDDPKALEHERPAAEYRSHPALDAGFNSWADFIACILLVDTSLVVQYGALAESRYTPAHNRVQKMLDEERFHFQYAAGWVRRMAAVPEVREELAASLARYLPQALQWLGDDDASGAAKRLVDEGLVSAGPSDLRARFLSRVVPVLADAGLADGLGLERRDGGEWTIAQPLSFDGWNEETRRSGGTLDEETAARARGDKNRALLLD